MCARACVCVDVCVRGGQFEPAPAPDLDRADTQFLVLPFFTLQEFQLLFSGVAPLIVGALSYYHCTTLALGTAHRRCGTDGPGETEVEAGASISALCLLALSAGAFVLQVSGVERVSVPIAWEPVSRFRAGAGGRAGGRESRLLARRAGRRKSRLSGVVRVVEL